MARPDRPRLVLCSDGAYAMALATTLRSAVESNPALWPLDVRVLCHDFPEPLRRDVLASLPGGSVQLHWLEVDVRPFASFGRLSHVSAVSYARLLIPDVLSQETGRVLYLDADLLVLDRLEPLWETDLAGAVLGAVRDGLDPSLNEASGRPAAVPGVEGYFNSGVLLIDLERWRKEQVSRRTLDVLSRHGDLQMMDQDGLNLACDGLWSELEPRWNHQVYYERRDRSAEAPDEGPGILHFVTRRKPWDFRRPNPYARLYDDFRSRTRFARTPAGRLRDAFLHRRFRLGNAVRQSALVRAVRGRRRRDGASEG